MRWRSNFPGVFFNIYMVKFRYKILFYLKLPVGYHGSVRKEFLC